MSTPEAEFQRTLTSKRKRLDALVSRSISSKLTVKQQLDAEKRKNAELKQELEAEKQKSDKLSRANKELTNQVSQLEDLIDDHINKLEAEENDSSES